MTEKEPIDIPIARFSFMGYTESQLMDMILACKEKGYDTLVAKLSAQSAEIEKLREALKEFGEHRAHCALQAPPEDIGYMGCSCGLDKALKGGGGCQ